MQASRHLTRNLSRFTRSSRTTTHYKSIGLRNCSVVQPTFAPNKSIFFSHFFGQIALNGESDIDKMRDTKYAKSLSNSKLINFLMSVKEVIVADGGCYVFPQSIENILLSH
eukprot:135515_1